MGGELWPRLASVHLYTQTTDIDIQINKQLRLTWGCSSVIKSSTCKIKVN